MNKILKNNVKGYMFLAPALIILITLTVIPFMSSFKLAFYRTDGLGVNVFIGLQNFVELFHDPEFYKSFGRLCIYAISIPLITIFPLIGAKLVCMVKNTKFAYLYRIIFVIPQVIPMMVGYLLWKQMYMDENGAINELLRLIGLGSFTHSWLGDPSTVILAIIFMGVPWVQGIHFLIYLTGFMKIPKSYYEAARLEGAKWYHIFWYIELPSIKPQIFLVLILAVIGIFQQYEQFLVITDGGPGTATTVPALYLFKNAFTYGRLGYATALGFMIFALCLIVTILNKFILLRNR